MILNLIKTICSKIKNVIGQTHHTLDSDPRNLSGIANLLDDMARVNEIDLDKFLQPVVDNILT